MRGVRSWLFVCFFLFYFRLLFHLIPTSVGFSGLLCDGSQCHGKTKLLKKSCDKFQIYVILCYVCKLQFYVKRREE